MKKSEAYVEQAHAAGEKLRRVVDGATDEVSEFSETVEHRIREKPVQATLLALAAGLLLGVVFGRR
jgi:ElaB/YqjD/DUF883 family membrane-anchored ribosome-binding protein